MQRRYRLLRPHPHLLRLQVHPAPVSSGHHHDGWHAVHNGSKQGAPAGTSTSLHTTPRLPPRAGACPTARRAHPSRCAVMPPPTPAMRPPRSAAVPKLKPVAKPPTAAAPTCAGLAFALRECCAPGVLVKRAGRDAGPATHRMRAAQPLWAITAASCSARRCVSTGSGGCGVTTPPNSEACCDRSRPEPFTAVCDAYGSCCRGVGGSCTNNNQCCGNSNTGATGGVCRNGQCCKAVGGTCTAEWECCNPGAVAGQNNICFDGRCKA